MHWGVLCLLLQLTAPGAWPQAASALQVELVCFVFFFFLYSDSKSTAWQAEVSQWPWKTADWHPAVPWV